MTNAAQCAVKGNIVDKCNTLKKKAFYISLTSTIKIVLFMKWNEINSFSRGSEFVTTPGSHHYQTVKPRLTVLLTRLIHQVCRYVAAGACFKRLCPHKHIIRLSCLLALQEKYFTIMDFLVLFLRHDPHWTGESTLSFFIANYKCPKAH